MATLEQLSAALVKADAAGNASDAKTLADAIRKMRLPVSEIPEQRAGVDQIPGYGGPVPASTEPVSQTQYPQAPSNPTLRALKAPFAGVYRGVQDITDTGLIAATEAMGIGGARTESQRQKAQFEQEYGGAPGAEVGRVGGQIIGTLPVGIAAAAPVKAAAKLAPSLARFLTPVATSLETAGFQTGVKTAGAPLATRAVNVGTRVLGGGVTGGAAAAAVNPEDAALGAAIGAAIPTVGRAAVKGGANYVRKLSDIKSATLLDAVEGRGADIINALESSGARIVPGSAPTAAQVAAPVGGTKFSALGQQLSELPDIATEYAGAAAQTNQARLAMDRRVADEFAAQAAKVKEQINRGLVNVSPTEVGDTLTGLARAERQAIKKGVTEPAYKAAFDLAGDARINVGSVVEKAEEILGRKLSDFATETAPDTVRKLRQFAPKPIEPEAVLIGKKGFKTAKPPTPPAVTPEATLAQLDDVRKAINADIAAASTSNAPMAATTLKNLRGLHLAIDDAIGKSTTLSDEAKTAYATAVDTYRTQYAPRFKEGVNANLFKRTSLSEGKIKPEDVINKYFTPNGESEARQFTQLFGNNPDALVVGREGIEDLFRQKVTDATGEVDPTKLAGFMKSYGRVIDIFDQSGMNLRARFDTITRDSKRLAQIAEEAAASGNKLSPALPPGTNALAIEKRISDLTAGMTPEQLTLVNAVRDDLAREAEARSLAAAGRASGQDIKILATTAGKESGIAPLVNVLYWPIAIYNNIAKRLMTSVDAKLALELAREMTNPAVTAQSIRKAMAVQGRQEAANALAAQAGTRAAPGIAAQAADENQNALNERPR